jgi:hypothetical protein
LAPLTNDVLAFPRPSSTRMAIPSRQVSPVMGISAGRNGNSSHWNFFKGSHSIFDRRSTDTRPEPSATKTLFPSADGDSDSTAKPRSLGSSSVRPSGLSLFASIPTRSPWPVAMRTRPPPGVMTMRREGRTGGPTGSVSRSSS